MFKKIFGIFVVFLFLTANFCLGKPSKVVLKVFHAGSLSVPFAKMEKVFEQEYPYIDIQREPSGSVRAIRKVIELHKPCDVIAVADYSLIPQMMFPKYTDHVKLFARNELVLCYTSSSKYASQINSQNWYQILQKKGVKWGFSNPNDDPCGYRTVIAIGLASRYYHKPNLINNLLGRNTNIIYQQTASSIIFKAPADLKTFRHKVFIRHKSVELLGLLESGVIDYAFEYKSVAKQHGLLFVKLPEPINLGSLKYTQFYGKCQVKLATGKVVKGKPIVYGITTLKTAPHPKAAQLWEDFVTSAQGQKILLDCNQTPIYPAKVITTK